MSTVEEIINAVKGLPPAERDEVQRKAGALINQSDQDEAIDSESRRATIDLDQRIQRALFEAGLVSEIKPPAKRPRERAPLIEIRGKPLSETVLEDSR